MKVKVQGLSKNVSTKEVMTQDLQVKFPQESADDPLRTPGRVMITDVTLITFT